MSVEKMSQKTPSKLKIQSKQNHQMTKKKLHQITSKLTSLGLVHYIVLIQGSSSNNIMEQNILYFKCMSIKV